MPSTPRNERPLLFHSCKSAIEAQRPSRILCAVFPAPSRRSPAPPLRSMRRAEGLMARGSPSASLGSRAVCSSLPLPNLRRPLCPPVYANMNSANQHVCVRHIQLRGGGRFSPLCCQGSSHGQGGKSSSSPEQRERGRSQRLQEPRQSFLKERRLMGSGIEQQERFPHSCHDGELVLLPPLLVVFQHGLQLHGGDAIAADQDEVL